MKDECWMIDKNGNIYLCFLRVRAGGKRNPQGTNSIYFRISSHGYNWYRVIVKFLSDTFRTSADMPNYIWVGHDEETNPPEITLFEGGFTGLIEESALDFS